MIRSVRLKKCQFFKGIYRYFALRKLLVLFTLCSLHDASARNANVPFIEAYLVANNCELTIGHSMI
jgi:hypothetical protein